MSTICGMCGSTHHTFTPRPNRDHDGAICVHCHEEENDAPTAHGPACRLPIDPVAIEAMKLVETVFNTLDPYMPGTINRLDNLAAQSREHLYRKLREEFEGSIRDALGAVSGPVVELAAPAEPRIPLEAEEREAAAGCVMCGTEHHDFKATGIPDECGDCGQEREAPCHRPACAIPREVRGRAAAYGAAAVMAEILSDETFESKELTNQDITDWLMSWRTSLEGALDDATTELAQLPAAPAPAPVETHAAREERTGCIMCGTDHHAYRSRLLPDLGRCSTCGCPRDAACHGPKCPLPSDARGLAEAYGASAVMCEILCDETFESRRMRADDIGDWLARWRLAMRKATDDAVRETTPARKPQ